MPRTAIYYNDVAGSPGQLMRNNVLFNTNRETVDTGPVYVYNRLAFVGDNAGGPSVVPDVSNHTQNLIRAWFPPGHSFYRALLILPPPPFTPHRSE